MRPLQNVQDDHFAYARPRRIRNPGVLTRGKQKRNPHDKNVVTSLALSYKNDNVRK